MNRVAVASPRKARRMPVFWVTFHLSPSSLKRWLQRSQADRAIKMKKAVVYHKFKVYASVTWVGMGWVKPDPHQEYPTTTNGKSRVNMSINSHHFFGPAADAVGYTSFFWLGKLYHSTFYPFPQSSIY